MRLRFGMLTVLTNIRSTKVLLAMPHSDFLAWLSSAILKNFILDFDAVKSKFGLLIE